MGVKQELVRWIFGTLAAPAFIQNLMSKFDIGIDGSSDRTQFIVKDGFGNEHVFITKPEILDEISGAGAGAVTSFTDLNDVPVSYIDQGNKVPIVNVAEDALEFTDLAWRRVGANVILYGVGSPIAVTLKEITEDGNSYAGTLIRQTDLHLDYSYEFLKNHVTMATFDDSYDCHNCFIKDDDLFYFIIADEGATVTKSTADGDLFEYNIPSTVSNGFVLEDYETKHTNVNGTIAYNGATIPTNLDTDYLYTFAGNICIMEHKTLGIRQECSGCYLHSDDTHKALTSNNIYPTVIYTEATTSESTAVWKMRQSTVKADAQYKNLFNIVDNGDIIVPG